MKILKFTAENIKKLRAVEITPDGHVVRITGRNGAGKSSVLDAIYWALAGAGTVDAVPVRQGEEKARIQLDLGTVLVTRRFTAAGGTSLTVESAEGAVFRSPQTVLDQLLGKLSFDPLAFTRMAPKEQLDALKRLVPVDVDLDALERENKAAYEARTGVNRRIKELDAQLTKLDAEIQPDVDTTLVDTSTLLAQMATASEHNERVDQERRLRADRADSLALFRRQAAEFRAKAAEWLRRAEHEEQAAADLERELAEAPPIPERRDVQELLAEVEAAQAANAAKEAERRRRDERHRLANDLQRLIGEQHDLTMQMVERAGQKEAAIARAAMPVDGLGFGDGEVLYRGLPLAQASSAEQLRVSVALAMAANPKLRVLRIRDGSLLDADSLKLLGEMVAAHDFQAWIEVAELDSPVGIQIEDGAVVAIDGEPVESEAIPA